MIYIYICHYRIELFLIPAENRVTILIIAVRPLKLFSYLLSTHSLNPYVHISSTTAAPLSRISTCTNLTGVMAYIQTERREHPTPPSRELIASSPQAPRPASRKVLLSSIHPPPHPPDTAMWALTRSTTPTGERHA